MKGELLTAIRNGEIVGIDGDGKVYTGYDTPEREYYMRQEEPYYDGADNVEPVLPVEDRRAIAEAMIARWREYIDGLA